MIPLAFGCSLHKASPTELKVEKAVYIQIRKSNVIRKVVWRLLFLASQKYRNSQGCVGHWIGTEWKKPIATFFFTIYFLPALLSVLVNTCLQIRLLQMKRDIRSSHFCSNKSSFWIFFVGCSWWILTTLYPSGHSNPIKLYIRIIGC